jgi:hypothetical protein
MDSRRLLSGSDGGFQVSRDAGESFDIINNVVLSQFYQIAYDLQKPYNVCGGLQDNGSWCGPSRTTHSAGIIADDWFSVSGGDGFYAIPVPDNHRHAERGHEAHPPVSQPHRVGRRCDAGAQVPLQLGFAHARVAARPRRRVHRRQHAVQER